MSKNSGFDQYTPGNNFKVWEKRFVQFLLREKIAEEDKTMWLITVIGSEPCEVLMNLTSPIEAETVAFQDLINILRKHYGPKTNKRSERFKFYKALQDNGESISEYIVRVRMLSQSCEFDTFLDEALSDKLITGLRSEKIQQELLNREETKFEKYCEFGLNIKLGEQSTRSMKSSAMSVVGSINKQTNNESQQSWNKKDRESSHQRQKNARGRSASRRSHHQHSGSRSRGVWSGKGGCRRCGRRHSEDTCPAKFWTCFHCGKDGHTSRVCSQKNQQLGSINAIGCFSQPCELSIKIAGQTIDVEIDTGAAVSVISEREYRSKLSKLCLIKSNHVLTTVLGRSISEAGTLKEIEVRLGNHSRCLDLVVLQGDQPMKMLMGRTWLDAFFSRLAN